MVAIVEVMKPHMDDIAYFHPNIDIFKELAMSYRMLQLNNTSHYYAACMLVSLHICKICFNMESLESKGGKGEFPCGLLVH